MPVLPQDNLNLNTPIQYEEQPGLTWSINRDTNRIDGTCDNWEAVRQAVEIILYTERFRWQIYKPYTGIYYKGLLGLDPGYVGVELKRRIKDALSVDSRITGIADYTYSFDDGIIHADFTVATVFGDIHQSVEVTMT